MNKLLLTALLITQLLSITACSSSAHVSFTPNRAEAEKSIIYIYRPTSMSNAMHSPEIFINNEVKFAIKNTSLRQITLPAGKYNIEIEPNTNYAGVTSITVDLIPNNNIYLRVDTKLVLNNAVRYEPYERTFSLVKVNEVTAIEEISACCATKEKAAETVEKETSVDNKNDAFSIDKTQNPFSH